TGSAFNVVTPKNRSTRIPRVLYIDPILLFVFSDAGSEGGKSRGNTEKHCYKNRYMTEPSRLNDACNSLYHKAKRFRNSNRDYKCGLDVLYRHYPIGNRTWKHVSPGLDSKRTLPRCLRTMRATLSRPRPVPSPTGLVVKNGSKMRDLASAGMPAPLSRISTKISVGSRFVRTFSFPPMLIASTALTIKLVHTWLSSLP